MGKIELDALVRISLKKEVFWKLPLIRKYVYKDEYFKMLIQYLTTIHTQPAERILDFISYTNDELVKQFGQRITQETAVVYYSSVLWEWFYLLAYYVHKLDNDPLWQENFLPHIKSFQIRSVAIAEMEIGEKLIDEYISKRRKVLEIKQQTITPKTEQSSQVEAQLRARIAELEEQNKELQAQLNVIHFSFIQTESKSPNDIRWAYEDIKKAIDGPSYMAACLHDLQTKGMIKGVERHEKLKGVKKIYKELHDAYPFTWTYEALCRAIKRVKAHK